MDVNELLTLALLPGRGFAGLAGALFAGCFVAGLANVGWLRWGGLIVAALVVVVAALGGTYPTAWIGVSGAAAVFGWLMGDAIREHNA